MNWFRATLQPSTCARWGYANIAGYARAFWGATFLALLLSLSASQAEAQGMFEVAGGASIPAGQLASMAETGFSIDAMLGGIRSGNSFGIYVEYCRYGQQEGTDSSNGLDLWMFTLCNRRAITTGHLSPYFRIFLGAGRVDDELEVLAQNWGIAVGAGLGLDLRRNSGFRWMVEIVPKVIGAPGFDGLVGFPSLGIRLGGWFEFGGTSEGE